MVEILVCALKQLQHTQIRIFCEVAFLAVFRLHLLSVCVSPVACWDTTAQRVPVFMCVPRTLIY